MTVWMTVLHHTLPALGSSKSLAVGLDCMSSLLPHKLIICVQNSWCLLLQRSMGYCSLKQTCVNLNISGKTMAGQSLSVLNAMLLLLTESTLFFVNMMWLLPSKPSHKAQVITKVKQWTSHMQKENESQVAAPGIHTLQQHSAVCPTIYYHI